MKLFAASIGCVSLSLMLLAPRVTAEEARKPNVLFIISDDLRPELGCYGNPVVKTPNLDRLASHGVIFGHAYCQQAVCGPSRASFLMGRRPDTTKVWDAQTSYRTALPNAVSLPQYFKDHGYYCSALGKVYHHGFEDGRSWNEPTWFSTGVTVDTDPKDWSRRIVTKIGPGVQEYKDIVSPEDNDKPMGGQVGPAFEVSDKTDDELPDGATAVEALKRMRTLAKGEQPFFLAVGFVKPHLPFVAPKQYWDLYDPDKIPKPAVDHLPDGAPEFAGHDNDELHLYSNVPRGNPIPEDFAKKLRHGYYACASYIDAQVGRLLDEADHSGLLDNTVVVFMGDHGWQLGEHGLWHKRTNFEIATRTTLIIRVPHAKSTGATCQTPVELIDIYPTLAEVCGLPKPADLDGTSMKPLLDDPAAKEERYALSQVPRGGPETDGHPLMGYSVRDAQWRLTQWKDRRDGSVYATELYDEKYDPDEAVNLAKKPENQSLIKTLSAHIPQNVPAFTGIPRRQPFGQFGGAGGGGPGGFGGAPREAGMGGGGFGGGPGGGGGFSGPPTMDRKELFNLMDANRDGKITREEFMERQPNAEMGARRFEKLDTNHDGVLTLEEFLAGGNPPAPGSPTVQR